MRLKPVLGYSKYLQEKNRRFLVLFIFILRRLEELSQNQQTTPEVCNLFIGLEILFSL